MAERKFWYAFCYSHSEELILHIKHKIMKKILLTSLLSLLVMAGMTLRAQDRADDYLGLPGDNLNLYAVMNLFQESETLEAFERKLNEENARVNNLDLNGDNYVDYIMVTDYKEGNVHNIVLQVALNPKEKQDVGVFTVERFRDGSVQIQLIGDEALYGRNYIVEPIYDETPNPGYAGNNRRNNDEVVRTTYVEVAAWPVIRYIYQPTYSVWRSSWYWGYYPEYWSPWTPYYYHHYYGYHYNYYPVYYRHYRHWHEPRYVYYHDHYYNRMRVYSPTVVVNINKGVYKKTYSRPETRRDGERMYTQTRSSRSSNLSTATSNSRRSATSADRSGASRRTEAASGRTTTRTTTGNAAAARRSTGNSSTGTASPSRESSQGRSTGTRPATRGTVTRPSSDDNGPAARSSAPSTRSTTARPASTESRSSAARPSGSVSTPRSSTARPSSSSSPAQPRSSEARSSSAPSRSSSTAAPRSSAPRSEPRQQSSARSSSSSRSTSAAPARSSSGGSSRSESAPRSSSKSSDDSKSSRK